MENGELPELAGTLSQEPARRSDIVSAGSAMGDSTLERYRLLSRRPALRLELRQGRAPLLWVSAALAGCGFAGLAVGVATWLFASAALAAAVALAALGARERWTIGARGVRFARAPWLPPRRIPRDAIERVTLRSGVGDGDASDLSWEVALEDGDGGGRFVFAFREELPARVLGALAVEALELERVEGGDGGPEIAAAVRDALARL